MICSQELFWLTAHIPIVKWSCCETKKKKSTHYLFKRFYSDSVSFEDISKLCRYEKSREQSGENRVMQ